MTKASLTTTLVLVSLLGASRPTPASAQGEAARSDVSAGPASNAAPQPQARPRLGLALGGGAARGIAHIGLLRWFEEHRIPIDYLAGTSMGGLIGGAYASGLSPAQIESMMKAAE